MWVVKLGGSLNGDPLLPQWLRLLAQLGGGRVTLVCGGGGFADQVRQAQRRWQFDDLTAHNMALLGMAQSAHMALGLQPGLELAGDEGQIVQVLHRGRCAVWLPLALCRDRPDADTHWGVTSDSLALDLARRLNAERLVVVKSCPVDRGANLPALVNDGVLDPCFAQRARDVGFPIELLHKSELLALRDKLLGLSN